jgi:AN1-like Zinc finger
MAQESCNLDKEKSDLLKSTPSPSITPPQSTVIPKPHEEIVFPKPETSMPDLATLRKPGKETNCSGTKLSCNRCLVCNRKVGIPGFRCRCGELFCAKHRYSDRHDCSFDYKSAGREEIARANPLIRASKIIKI